MINTPTIKDIILEGTRISEIRDYIAAGREQYGMQTFDQHLADLVRSGEVTYEVAVAASSKPSDFALNLQMLGGGVPVRPSGTIPAVGAPAPSTPARPSTQGKPPEPEPSATPGNGFGAGGAYDFLNGNG
jgi:twitching motility protein PilT